MKILRAGVFALWAASLGTISTLEAATYYVSPGGDAGNPGTRGRPWTTAKANQALAAGDTGVFLEGDYARRTDCIEPARDGRPDGEIVYRSEKPRVAVLRPDKNAIRLDSRRHIVIDGFFIVPRAGSGWGYVRNGTSDCTIQNCRMEAPERPTWGTFVALKFDNAHRIRFLNNTLRRHITMDRGLHGCCNMMTCYHSSHCLFEGNIFEMSGHQLFGFGGGGKRRGGTEYNVVRGNVFCNEWGRCFEFFEGARTLFENNVVMGGFDSNGSYSGRSKMHGRDLIVRNNLVWRNWDCPFTSDRYAETLEFRDSRAYHNVFYGNYTLAWQLRCRKGSATNMGGNVWQNNVFFRNDVWGGFYAIAVPDNVVGGGNRWRRNVFCGDSPGRKVVCWNTGWDPRTGTHYTAGEANAALPDFFRGNLDVDPLFRDPERGDFRLARGSPCLDAGEPLARAASAGSGRSVAVDDARWFYDGFGIPGEQGDVIMIGPRKIKARVVALDLDRNTLKLDRKVRWRADDSVTLAYAGRAPDIGALEFGAERETWFRPIPSCKDFGWRPPEGPAEPLMTTDFEDADMEAWFYYWNLRRSTGTDYEVDRTTGAAGTSCSLRLRAKKDGQRLAAYLTPRMWDIDRYPWVSLAYRMTAGARLGVVLDAFDNSSRSKGWLYVGGTPGYDTEGKPDLNRYRLLADDRWHELVIDARAIREVYPEVRGLQAFHIRGTLDRNQSVWIDQFAISPLPPGSLRPAPRLD